MRIQEALKVGVLGGHLGDQNASTSIDCNESMYLSRRCATCSTRQRNNYDDGDNVAIVVSGIHQ